MTSFFTENEIFDWRHTAIWGQWNMPDHAAREIRLQRFMSGTLKIGEINDFAEEHADICCVCGENQHKGSCEI